jgi:hypothetical protein
MCICSFRLKSSKRTTQLRWQVCKCVWQVCKLVRGQFSVLQSKNTYIHIYMFAIQASLEERCMVFTNAKIHTYTRMSSSSWPYKPTHVHTYIHTYIHTHEYLHSSPISRSLETNIRAYMHAYIHTYTQIHTCFHTRQISRPAFGFADKHTYMHTYIYTHTCFHTRQISRSSAWL